MTVYKSKYDEREFKREHLADHEILASYKIKFFFAAIWSSKWSILTAIIIYVVWSLVLAYCGLHFAPTLNSSFVGVLVALTTFFVTSIVSDNFTIYRNTCAKFAVGLSKIENFTLLITSGIKSRNKPNIKAHMILLSELVTAAIYSFKHNLRGDLDINQINISKSTKKFIDGRLIDRSNLIGSDVYGSMCNNAIEASITELILNMYTKDELSAEMMRLSLCDLELFNDIRDELGTVKATKFLAPRSGIVHAGILFMIFFLSPELNTMYGVYYGFAALLIVILFYFGAVAGSDLMSEIWIKDNVYSTNGFSIDVCTERSAYINKTLFESWKSRKEIDAQIGQVSHELLQ